MPLTIVEGDIARMDTDAVVNAANERLLAGGGVCGAIFAGAGREEMQAACDAIGHCPTGGAVVTPGFALPARIVVHAVGPLWRGGGHGEEALLRSAYRSALSAARDAGARSISFPVISAGIYGYPADAARRVAADEIGNFLREGDDLDVRLVIHDRASFARTLDGYERVAARVKDLVRGTAPLGYAAGASADGSRAAIDADASFSVLAESAPCVPAQAPSCARPAPPRAARRAAVSDDLTARLARLDASFAQTVLALIDERGLTDVEVYKRANLSRQVFSKLRRDDGYRPTKQTAVALSVAIELDLEQTEDLLRRAGYALSRSNEFDVIVEYFIDSGRHDVFELNEMLFAFDQPLLGSL